MKVRMLIAAATLAISASLTTSAAFAAELFNGGTPNSTTVRGASSGPGQSIAVTTATTLTNIGFYSASPSGGNVKYLIFDAAGSTLLFSVTAAASASSTVALVLSPTFSFDLAAGTSYQFGIISDSALNVGFDFPPSFVSQNGLTSFGTNHNYTNFANPQSAGDAFASIPVVLYGTQSGAVPEPATWGMMLAGFGMVGGAVRYRRRGAKLAYA